MPIAKPPCVVSIRPRMRCPGRPSKTCSKPWSSERRPTVSFRSRTQWAGTIHRNYDLLLEHELPIVGEVQLPIVHSLLAYKGTTIEDVAACLLAPASTGAV